MDETEPELDLGQISFDPDPAPKTSPRAESRAAKKETAAKASAPARPVGRPSNDSVREEAIAELAEEVRGLLMMIGMPLVMRDRHEDGSSCGDLFIAYDEAQKKAIPSNEVVNWAQAFAEVGVDNKFIKGFFSSADKVGKYTALAMATLPFVQVIGGNHQLPMRRNSGNDSAAGIDYSSMA